MWKRESLSMLGREIKWEKLWGGGQLWCEKESGRLKKGEKGRKASGKTEDGFRKHYLSVVVCSFVEEWKERRGGNKEKTKIEWEKKSRVLN